MKCKYSKHSWIVHALQSSRKKYTYINSNTCQTLLFTWPNMASERAREWEWKMWYASKMPEKVEEEKRIGLKIQQSQDQQRNERY